MEQVNLQFCRNMKMFCEKRNVLHFKVESVSALVLVLVRPWWVIDPVLVASTFYWFWMNWSIGMLLCRTLQILLLLILLIPLLFLLLFKPGRDRRKTILSPLPGSLTPEFSSVLVDSEPAQNQLWV